MEDTLICKSYYAYQFRVDIAHSKALIKFTQWRDKYDCSFYLAGLETSEKHKEHLQAIVWFATTVNTVKLRNWWIGKTTDTKQPVSLTSAKKVKSLAAYCSKDKNYYTNLDQTQLALIPKWKPILKDKTFHDLIHTTIQNSSSLCLDKYEIGEIILDLYKVHDKMVTRNRVLTLLWKYNYISNRSYLVNYLNI